MGTGQAVAEALLCLQVANVSLPFPAAAAQLLPVTMEQARKQQEAQLTAALVQMAHCEQQQPVPSCCKLQGFDDPQLAFSAKSTGQLVQSLAVFRTCSVKPLVQNADVLLAAARKVVGPAVVTSVVRHTFFKHFCGGEPRDAHLAASPHEISL